MLQKLKPHFLKLGPRRFVIGTVILLVILDLINSYYLRIWWQHRDLSIQMTKTIAIQQGVDWSTISNDTVKEVRALIDNAFYFFLFIVLINNFFFYAFYLRKKLWAQGYVLFYTLTTSIFAITFLVEGPILGMPWYLYNLATLFIYAYLYLGVKLLKYETTDIAKPIPEGETKAQ
jgi:hypothetical protein